MQNSHKIIPERLVGLILFAGTLLFLFLTFPENRSEADDAFWYAALVRDEPVNALYNPRFLLFLPLIKAIYILIPVADAYIFMCVVSMLFAAGILVLLRRILLAHTNLDRAVVWWIILLTLLSYEFWRYSFESEVYMIAIFLILLTLDRQLKIYQEGLNGRRLVILILVSSFTVLVYKPAFLAVFIAFPLFFLFRKLYRALVLFYATSGVAIIGVYYLTYLLYTLGPENFISHLLGGVNNPTGSALMAPVVVISNFCATAWIFGVEELKSTVTRVFAHKVMMEELLTASQVNGWSYFLIVLVLLLVTLFLFLVINAIREIRRSGLEWTGFYWVMTALIDIYGGFLLVMDPSSNEPWLILSIPIAIILGKLLIQPLGRRGSLIIPWTFVLILGVYNYIGGIGLLQNRNVDYNFLKADWLNNHTGSNDLVLSLGPMSFVRYIDYYSKASVYNYEEQFMKGNVMIDTLHGHEGNIYLTNDMITPPRAITFRSKITAAKLDSLYRYYQYIVQPVDTSSGFVTYKLVKNEH